MKVLYFMFHHFHFNFIISIIIMLLVSVLYNLVQQLLVQNFLLLDSYLIL